MHQSTNTRRAVPVYTAALIGFITSVCCFYTFKYKHIIGVDEGLDIFAIHGVGGFIGDILTGFFAADFVPAMDGVTTTNPGGWWNRNWIQMGYQLAAATTCATWSFVISCLLLFIINKIPGMHIRESDEDEQHGLDRKYFSDADYEAFGLSQYGLDGTSQPAIVKSGSDGEAAPATVDPGKRD